MIDLSLLTDGGVGWLDASGPSSHLVLATHDAVRAALSAADVFGMGPGIPDANLYYPAVSLNGTVMPSRIGTSFSNGVMGNLLSEFWPDIRTRVLSRFGPWKKNVQE